MPSITPFALKRRTISRIAASNPRVRSMEQRAHNRCLQAYSSEILDHLSQLEDNTKSQPDMIMSQPEINIEMRPILFDFLMDVHNRLKLCNSTFFLTINIIDRYCSLRIVRKDHYQLLGLTALWLASKFSDSKHKVPTLDFLRATCCNCYSKKLFVEMETHILKSLNWEIGSAGHDSFIDLMLREKLNSETTSVDTINSIKYGSNYLCQLMQLYTSITFKYSISQIAIASVLIMTSSLTLLNENEFIHYKNTTNNNLQLSKLIGSILQIIRENQPPLSFKMKYFNKLDDLRTNPTLYSIYQYSNELERLNIISKAASSSFSANNVSLPLSSLSTPTEKISSVYFPQTPSSMCSTPVASRTGSTSSESSSTSSTFSSKDTHANYSFPTPKNVVTPPSSGSSSPVNQSNNQRSSTNRGSRIFKLPNVTDTIKKVSNHELRIVAPQSFKINQDNSQNELNDAGYQSVEHLDQTIRKRSLEI